MLYKSILLPMNMQVHVLCIYHIISTEPRKIPAVMRKGAGVNDLNLD